MKYCAVPRYVISYFKVDRWEHGSIITVNSEPWSFLAVLLRYYLASYSTCLELYLIRRIENKVCNYDLADGNNIL